MNINDNVWNGVLLRAKSSLSPEPKVLVEKSISNPSTSDKSIEDMANPGSDEEMKKKSGTSASIFSMLISHTQKIAKSVTLQHTPISIENQICKLNENEQKNPAQSTPLSDGFEFEASDQETDSSTLKWSRKIKKPKSLISDLINISGQSGSNKITKAETYDPFDFVCPDEITDRIDPLRKIVKLKDQERNPIKKIDQDSDGFEFCQSPEKIEKPKKKQKRTPEKTQVVKSGQEKNDEQPSSSQKKENVNEKVESNQVKKKRKISRKNNPDEKCNAVVKSDQNENLSTTSLEKHNFNEKIFPTGSPGFTIELQKDDSTVKEKSTLQSNPKNDEPDSKFECDFEQSDKNDSSDEEQLKKDLRNQILARSRNFSQFGSVSKELVKRRYAPRVILTHEGDLKKSQETFLQQYPKLKYVKLPQSFAEWAKFQSEVELLSTIIPDSIIPPLHQFFWTSRQATVEIVKDMGYQIKMGRFTEKEDEIVSRNFANFCKKHPLPVNYLLGFNVPKDEVLSRRKFLENASFYQCLAKDLPLRPLCAVKARARVILHEYREKGVKRHFYSKEECEKLRNLITKSPGNYNALAEEVNLDPSRLYKLKRKLELKASPLSETDRQRLRDAVVEHCKTKGIDIFKGDINFQAIANSLSNITESTCRVEWRFLLPKIIEELLLPLIKKLLEFQFESYNKIDWESVAENSNLGSGRNACQLLKCTLKFRRKLTRDEFYDRDLNPNLKKLLKKLRKDFKEANTETYTDLVNKTMIKTRWAKSKDLSALKKSISCKEDKKIVENDNTD